MNGIRIDCHTENCGNYQKLHHDSDLPKHWLCSACEDEVTRQQLDDMERRHLSTVRGKALAATLFSTLTSRSA